MSNIESRPLPGRKWEYGFYVDVIGNLDDPAIRNSLAGIKEETKDFKILGNFSERMKKREKGKITGEIQTNGR